MTNWLWRIVRWRLGRAVPSSRLPAALGDLSEDYAKTRASQGALPSGVWLMRETRSLTRAYATTPRLRWLAGDVRYALRRWRRRPGFAITAIVTLALGIGATTSIFSVVNAVLLKPLPWPEADRLVAIHAVQPERRNNPAFAATWNRGYVSRQSWQALRKSSAFEDVGVWFRDDTNTIGDTDPEVVEVMHASSSFLSLVGVQPILGRLFTADEDRADSNAVIISHELWLRHFGGRAGVVGEPAKLQGQLPRTIVGILPPGFRFQGEPPDFVMPMGRMAYNGTYGNPLFNAIGRLAPGVSVGAAGAAAEPLVRRDEPREKRTARVVSITEDQIGHAARPLWLTLGGAGLLLLVACSNVAGLLLGEARSRRHEIAVRTALGGSFRRVLRQLAVEQVLLSSTAAAAGVMLAIWITPLLVTLAPGQLPRLDTVAVDARIAAFALGLGLLTSLVFALVPAISLARTPAVEVLAEGSRDGAASRQAGQHFVVAAEIALALVLLVAASLFAETMLRLTSRPLGFEPAGLAVIAIRPTRLPGTTSITAADYNALTTEQKKERGMNAMRRHSSSWTHTAGVLERLSGVPRVIAAAGVATAPFAGGWTSTAVRAQGHPVDRSLIAQRQVITQGYFRTMGLAILSGRDFERSDHLMPPLVTDRRAPLPTFTQSAVISREFERRVFEGGAIGRKFLIGPAAYDVIGVVPNARQREFSDDDLATFYVLDHAYDAVKYLIVRTAGQEHALLPAVRQAIKDYDPYMAVTSTTTMNDLVARSVAEERFRAQLSVVFGAAALILAAVGLYSLAARRVAERRREIGVRVSLGARPQDIRSLVLKDAMKTVAFGLVVGLPGAFAASQIGRSFLFGVSPHSPYAFVIAAGTLALAAIVATLGPARRAGRIDPIQSLRN